MFIMTERILTKIKNYIYLYKIHIAILITWFVFQVVYFWYIYFNIKDDPNFSNIFNKLDQ